MLNLAREMEVHRALDYNCPAGTATQKEEFWARLNIDEASARLARFL